MTTYFPRTATNPFGKICIALIVILIIVISIVFLSDTSHAFARHGEEANLGRECAGKGSLYFNPSTSRYGNVCLTTAGFFGVWIYEMVDGEQKEVTSFVKNKMKSESQVDSYMKNAGYQPVSHQFFINCLPEMVGNFVLTLAIFNDMIYN
jgi:hypothetical protein